MKLEEKMIYLRKEKGLSQLQLAEMMDVSRQAVSRWETGVSVPSSENLKYLSNLYHVSLDYLLSDDEDELLEKEEEPVKQSAEEHNNSLIKAEQDCRSNGSFLHSDYNSAKHRRVKFRNKFGVYYILYLATMGILLMLGAITSVRIVPEFAITLDFGLIINYLNIFGIFFVIAVCLVVLIFTKSVGAIKDAFLFMFRSQNLTLMQFENCLLAVKTVVVSAFISGGILFAVSVVNVMYSMNLNSSARSYVGPQLGMGMASLVYSCIIFFMFLPVYLFLKRGLIQKRTQKYNE